MEMIEKSRKIGISIYGCDDLIVNSARVSFDKNSSEYSTERNIRLIEYLFQHKHLTPFEHVFIFLYSQDKEFLWEVYTKWKKNLKNYHPIYYSKGKEKDFIVFSLRTFMDIYQNILNEKDKILVKHILYKICYYLPSTSEIIGIKSYLKENFDIEVKMEKNEYSKCRNNIKVVELGDIGKVLLIDKTNFGIDMDIYSFMIECPIYVARQWMRHRFGVYNEVSRRYVDYEPDIYIPEYIRIRDKNIKQGSKDKINEYDKLIKFLMKIHGKFSKFLYNLFIKNLNVPPEQARGILPLSLKTKFYWSVPKISLENFINLRTEKHAQKEIRIFADAIKNIIENGKRNY